MPDATERAYDRFAAGMGWFGNVTSQSRLFSSMPLYFLACSYFMQVAQHM